MSSSKKVTSSKTGPTGASSSSVANASSGPAVATAKNMVFFLDKKGLHRMPIQAVMRYRKPNDTEYFLTIATKHDNRAIELTGEHPYQVFFANTNPKRLAGCRLSGLFYAGAHKTGDQTENPMQGDRHCATYWRDTARRQYGAHVFAYASGQLALVVISLNVVTGLSEQTSNANVNQLCPAMRVVFRNAPKLPEGTPREPPLQPNQDDWVTSIGTYKLLYALLYRAFTAGQYSTLGDRYHTRDGQSHKCQTWGGVFELTDDNEEVSVNVMAVANTKPIGRFAIYVCAGAKLVVLDQYLQTVHPSGKHHNRTLVQAGGLVVVEGKLELMAPEFGASFQTFRLRDVTDDTKPKCLFSKNPLSYAAPAETDTSGKAPASKPAVTVAAPVFPKTCDPNLKKYAEYDFPVLFLGANESEYGSIAWELEIEQQPRPGTAAAPAIDTTNMVAKTRRCFLTIPEGGRFEAIAKWTEGMEEVRARHLYERLHEASVVAEGTPPMHIPANRLFSVPKSQAMLETILGIGADRTVYTDIHVMRAEFRSQQLEKDRSPLPVIYNGYKCTQWPSITAKPNLQPFVKPDWPIIRIDDDLIGFRTNHLSFMGTGWEKYDVSAAANQPVLTSNQIYQIPSQTSTRGRIYTREKTPHPLDVYQYTRLKYGQSAPADKYDGVHAYVGIDGYHYEKDAAVTEVVGQYNALWYRHSNPPEAATGASQPGSPKPGSPKPGSPKPADVSPPAPNNQIGRGGGVDGQSAVERERDRRRRGGRGRGGGGQKP